MSMKRYVEFISEQEAKNSGSSQHTLLASKQQNHLHKALMSHIKADGDEKSEHHNKTMTHLNKSLEKPAAATDFSHPAFHKLEPKVKSALHQAWTRHKNEDEYGTLLAMDKAATLHTRV